MFPEMHLTVNEVEKMAVGEKIKFWQILELERGGKKKKKAAVTWGGSAGPAPHAGSRLLLGIPPRSELLSRTHAWHSAYSLRPYRSQATSIRCLSRQAQQAYRADWQICETVITEEKEKGKTCSKIFGLL